MISKNFYEALNSIAEERGLAVKDIIDKVQQAMAIACKNSDVPYKGDIKIECDQEKKRIRFFNYYYVVKELNPEGVKGEITLEDAIEKEGTEKKKEIKVGDVIKEEIDLAVFKRKAASLFRQTLLSELKDLERKEAYEYFSGKVGEMLLAKVENVIPEKYIVFDMEKDTQATMSFRDALPNEEFRIGEVKRVLLTKVEQANKGPRLYLSRNSKEIVKKVFAEYIPEIAKGSVEIVGLARDAGSRSKVGVRAVSPNIDPKGACVGAGGSRIKAINDALGGEKVDIFTWRDEPAELITDAMSPAAVLRVTLAKDAKQATVTVPDDQFSLAIGKNGQNARLAAIATGWRIDIKKESDASEQGEDDEQACKDVATLKLSQRTLNSLNRAGILKISDITDKTEDEMMKIRNLGIKSLKEIEEKLNEQGLGFKKTVYEERFNSGRTGRWHE